MTHLMPVAPRPSRPSRAAVALATLALLMTATPAFAIDEEDLDEVPGEAVLKMRHEFVKFTVDGRSSWENHHYEDKFKTLVVRGLSRTDDHTIVLTPMDDTVEPFTLTLTPSDFKRKKIRKKIDGRKRRVTVFRAERRIKFAKKSAGGDKKPAEDTKKDDKPKTIDKAGKDAKKGKKGKKGK